MVGVHVLFGHFVFVPVRRQTCTVLVHWPSLRSWTHPDCTLNWITQNLPWRRPGRNWCALASPANSTLTQREKQRTNFRNRSKIIWLNVVCRRAVRRRVETIRKSWNMIIILQTSQEDGNIEAMIQMVPQTSYILWLVMVLVVPEKLQHNIVNHRN